MTGDVTADLAERLAEPFAADEVRFKPQTVKGNRAMATAYIDARLVMDRLDEVFGPAGWQDEYTPLANGSVVCRLSVCVGGNWVSKTDVGSPSEQPDEGDRTKAAFSDALKRAAVKLGVGRYLYRVGGIWADFDPARKQFTGRPQLPAWALPKPATVTRTLPAAPYADPAALPAADPAKGKPAMPADGAELHARLRAKDAELSAAGRFPAGALLTHVAQLGAKAGFGDDISKWGASAMAFAAVAVTEFVKVHGTK